MTEENRSSINTTGGARYTVVPTERKVKHYAVAKLELEELSTFNALTTGAFSVGSGFLGYVIDGLIDLFSTKPPAGTMREVISFSVLSVVCFMVGILAWSKKGSILSKITSLED